MLPLRAWHCVLRHVQADIVKLGGNPNLQRIIILRSVSHLPMILCEPPSAVKMLIERLITILQTRLGSRKVGMLHASGHTL